ncbi:TonB-dependent receptor [Sediminicola sp. 1XM1-17]|uniref:TonB-dependent receptor n=1 Tax=Sediminicola sp. 1XM1-17 TaxID=3127702 RepID=UPI003077320F
MKPIFLILALLLGHLTWGQVITGKVLDANKEGVEGAYIFNHLQEKHTHSNELGSFKLQQTYPGDTLLIGALGFQKLEYVLRSEDFGAPLNLILEEDIYQLEEVIIRPNVNGINVVADIDLKTAPVKSSQDLLQKVPGLIIGQHAGGGKAEQLFLRGFDIDHGTDIAIGVDGMPVNMVSHAHGQGYADLHFVIPETLDNIDFGKGPYYSDHGNFGTAAYVDFGTKQRLKNSTVQLEYGDFGWNRTLGMFSLLNDDTQAAYVATELIRFDGPFESPQNFSRLNIFGKYTAKLSDQGQFSLSASHFTSEWDASGQIPQRAVDNGSISRFGAIDDTEGGTTERTNLNVSLKKVLDENSFVKANAYYSNYKFQLYSNFTFFLEDPINGDQIMQKEERDLFGLNAELNKNINVLGSPALLRVGTGFRTDNIQDNELSRTLNRRTSLANIQLGDVTETNVFGYANAEITWNKWTVAPALRIDNFSFNYVDALAQEYRNQSVGKTIVSPKLNFTYTDSADLQFFLKSGIGFHSNDTRVVVAQDGNTILPAAYGTDLGTIWRPTSKMLLNITAWYLYMEQEFVYVGDAGIVEPSGRTERLGVDFGLRYQFTDWLYLNTDATYTHARSLEDPKGMDFIPLAPDFTLVGGLGIINLGRLSGGLRFRYLDDRPANEDNSIVAKGYTVTDLNVNYLLTKNLSMGMSIENLFDTEWNETQFATESRLENENDAVEEIHFTPGTPFFVKASLSYNF